MHFENSTKKKRIEEKEKEVNRINRSVNSRLECCAQSDIFCTNKEIKKLKRFRVRGKKPKGQKVKFCTILSC